MTFPLTMTGRDTSGDLPPEVYKKASEEFAKLAQELMNDPDTVIFTNDD